MANLQDRKREEGGLESNRIGSRAEEDAAESIAANRGDRACASARVRVAADRGREAREEKALEGRSRGKKARGVWGGVNGVVRVVVRGADVVCACGV